MYHSIIQKTCKNHHKAIFQYAFGKATKIAGLEESPVRRGQIWKSIDTIRGSSEKETGFGKLAKIASPKTNKQELGLKGGALE